MFKSKSFLLKQIVILFSLLILVGCDSNEKNPVIQKKLDKYFDYGSNINVEREIRLKYIDSARILIQESNTNDSIQIRNYFKVANRYFGILEYEKYKLITEEILKISKSKNQK